MRDRLKIFLYLTAYLLGFQIIIRGVFLLYNYRFSAELTPHEVMLVFLYGLKMDASICGYFLMLTGIILSISVFTQARLFFISIHFTLGLLLLLSLVVVVVDLELYRHWGFRLNTSPLFYVGPEAAGSVDISVILNLSTILIVLIATGIFIYFRLIAPEFRRIKPTGKKSFVPLILISALMFIPIRGSFTVAPMNTGFVYFHRTKAFANHAAINVVWNFLYSLRKSASTKYAENFFEKMKAEKYFQSLYPESDSTLKIFKIPRPNIILFILESFTANVIEPLGGIKGVSPNLNKLCDEGFLFDNFYASGDRTDKGIISILSGYPAQPLTSIIKYPAKTQRLPYLNHYFEKLGYTTSFVYGGDIDFANFRSYLTSCRFQHITTEDDFPYEVNESKWGVHDHLVLDQAFSECDTATAPFFKTILTLSSHEPFDVPMVSGFSGQSEKSLFLNSCHYTDSCIGKFINDAKQRPWWKNTVVIFVADHGHRLPLNYESKDKERFKIPFLMVGGAVQKDSIVHSLGGQTDIANTLLGQLDKPSRDFPFSKNMLSPDSKSFAVYFYSDGYGFLLPETYIIHDNPGNQFLKKTGASMEDLELSKAYQQILYSDYNKR